MNLEERVAYIQTQMEQALREGASQGDILMYESAIAELVRINEWILEQSKTNNRIYFEDDGRMYMFFKNTTGIDFRFFAMTIKVIDEEKVVDTYEVASANWGTGKWAKFYFDVELKENSVLEIAADTIEYQVMNSKNHR